MPLPRRDPTKRFSSYWDVAVNTLDYYSQQIPSLKPVYQVLILQEIMTGIL